MKLLFLISGTDKGVGKDTVGELLSEYLQKIYEEKIQLFDENDKDENMIRPIISPFIIKRSFCESVYCALNDIFDTEIDSQSKGKSFCSYADEFTNLQKPSIRDTVVWLAEGMKGLFGKNLWAELLVKKLEDEIYSNEKFFKSDTFMLITDLRFKAELETMEKFAEANDAEIIKILVTNEELTDAMRETKSDDDKTEYDWMDINFDKIVFNTGTIDQLEEEMYSFADKMVKYVLYKSKIQKKNN